jgi:site-specific recombinase XerC
LKDLKTFFGWCVGRGVIDFSPAQGIPNPGQEKDRDRVLDDAELADVILAGQARRNAAQRFKRISRRVTE